MLPVALLAYNPSRLSAYAKSGTIERSIHASALFRDTDAMGSPIAHEAVSLETVLPVLCPILLWYGPRDMDPGLLLSVQHIQATTNALTPNLALAHLARLISCSLGKSIPSYQVHPLPRPLSFFVSFILRYPARRSGAVSSSSSSFVSLGFNIVASLTSITR